MTLSSFAFLISFLWTCSNTLCGNCELQLIWRENIYIKCTRRGGGGEDGDGNLPITRHVKLLVILIFLDASQNRWIRNAHGLQQCCQVLKVEMPVWASVGLARAGWVLRQNLLAGVGRVATPTTVRVPADIAIYVSYIVPVFLVESVVRDLVECTAPEG